METIAVYEVRCAPDGPLSQVREALEEDGFTVEAGEELDLDARRGLDRIFVGIGPHEDGLVVRWKAKSLVPGRAHGLHDLGRRAVTEALGQPDRVNPAAGGSR